MSWLKKTSDSLEASKSVAKVEWLALTDVLELNLIVEKSSEIPILIFKHSTRCGISRMVLRQFENEFNFHDKIKSYYLDLLQHRDISNEIASRFDIKHQSPQVIVLKKGKVVYDASHESIDASKLKELV